MRIGTASSVSDKKSRIRPAADPQEHRKQLKQVTDLGYFCDENRHRHRAFWIDTGMNRYKYRRTDQIWFFEHMYSNSSIVHIYH